MEQLIEQISAKKEKVNFIFMVGGFSESPYLKSEIIKRFETDMIQVLVPRRPQISVIRGACMFGLNPRSITSRIAKRTYGINTLTTFDPDKHPEEKKVFFYKYYNINKYSSLKNQIKLSRCLCCL